MLVLDTQVHQGIMFIRVAGSLNSRNFMKLNQEINYLLYHQGAHYYVFNFQEIATISKKACFDLQNKLVEIFLSCGKVVMCGMNEFMKKYIGVNKDSLFYVNNEVDAFRYLSI